MNNVKKTVFAGMMSLVLLLTGCSDKSEEKQTEYKKDIFAMDTFMTIKAYGDKAEIAVDEAEREIVRLESLFSVTDTDSDVSKINLNAGTSAEVSDDTIMLLTYALDYCQMTDGALDITVYPILREWGFTTGEYKIPDNERIKELLAFTDYRKIKISGNTVSLEKNTKIDIGSTAKGYTGDRIAEIMQKNGVDSALINLGGNVQAVGTKPDGSKWKIGIQDPENSGEIVCTLSVSDCAVVTSGNYERYFVGADGKKYCHIIDPKTGYPADNGVISASVIGKSGVMCDALSTALFVMGTEKAIAFCKSHHEIDAVIITNDKKMYVTEGLEDMSAVSYKYELSFIKR